MPKKILSLTTILFAVASASLIAEQNPTDQPKTQLESFLAKKGSIVIKQFHEIGVVPGQLGAKATLTAIVLFEPGRENDRTRGIKIEVTEIGRIERQSTAFLDMDEIDSLIKGLDYMAKLLTDWQGTQPEYTEVVFSTRGDFDAGFYLNNGRSSGFIKAGRIGGATAFLQTGDLAKMRSLLDAGRTHLNAK